MVEMGASGFSMTGFLAFSFSAFLESVRVVYIQLLLSSRLKYNAVEVSPPCPAGSRQLGPGLLFPQALCLARGCSSLHPGFWLAHHSRYKLNRPHATALQVLVFLGPPTAAVLLAASFIWEWDGLTKGGGFQLMANQPWLYAVGLLMGFAVNLSTASAIRATSSLTFKVFGCLKNTLVVAAGVALGDQVSGLQVGSYGISIAGFCTYTYAKWQEGQHLTQTAKKQS